jgi:hypothetical protein
MVLGSDAENSNWLVEVTAQDRQRVAELAFLRRP